MKHGVAYFELKQEIEEFLYQEADLLDGRKFREWLDLLADDLEVTATRLAGDQASAVYEFSLRSGQGPILTGRAAVVLDA